MFDLLAPLFAAVGIAAATVPVVLHMLRRSPSQMQEFSLVRFLRPSLPKMTKRSRIEHWPLLLLRILALLLIGVAFARPFQRIAMSLLASRGDGDRIAILLDASASMRRDGIRDQLIQQLRRATEELSDRDVVSISQYSRSVKTLLSAEEWARTEPSARSALIEQVIKEYEPDWMDTRTAAAMLFAADDVTSENNAKMHPTARRVVLITDFQRGSQLDELRSAAWPEGVAVDLHIVNPLERGNAGVTLLDESPDEQTRIRVSNSLDAETVDFHLQPFDREGISLGEPISVSVAPGQRRSVIVPTVGPEGLAPVAGVSLEGDPHAYDNVVDLPMTLNPVRQIAHIGGTDFNNEESMRYYLQRVIDGNHDLGIELVDVYQPDGVTLPVAEDIRMVMITGPVAPDLVPSVRACLDRGGLVVAAVDSLETALSVQPILPGTVEWNEAAVTDYAMFGRIDFEHPLFAAFSGVRFSDFSGIRFWHHRTLKTAETPSPYRTIAAFDNGDPMIAEFRTPASGRVMILTAGWHPGDSQWALSTRFPPLLSSLIRMAHPVSTGQIIRSVGDRIVPEEMAESADWSLQFPDESVLTSDMLSKKASDQERGRAQQSADQQDVTAAATAAATDSLTLASTMADKSVLLEMPGRYVLTALTGHSETGNAVPAELTLIVGLPASESSTDVLPVGQLQAMGLDAGIAETNSTITSEEEAAVMEQLASEELESRQKWWRWLILAGLFCLLAESLLASGIERRRNLESAA
ncbi:MAG: BatA domain-containing protein [Planctomycetaceae bacterium]|nr:BatA domain-containing protein [Planctomycetaceae bacterium]